MSRSVGRVVLFVPSSLAAWIPARALGLPRERFLAYGHAHPALLVRSVVLLPQVLVARRRIGAVVLDPASLRGRTGVGELGRHGRGEVNSVVGFVVVVFW